MLPGSGSSLRTSKEYHYSFTTSPWRKRWGPLLSHWHKFTPQLLSVVIYSKDTYLERCGSLLSTHSLHWDRIRCRCSEYKLMTVSNGFLWDSTLFSTLQYRATILPAFKYYITCACLIFFCIFIVQILVLPKYVWFFFQLQQSCYSITQLACAFLCMTHTKSISEVNANPALRLESKLTLSFSGRLSWGFLLEWLFLSSPWSSSYVSLDTYWWVNAIIMNINRFIYFPIQTHNFNRDFSAPLWEAWGLSLYPNVRPMALEWPECPPPLVSFTAR